KPQKALDNYIAFSELKDSLANQKINKLEMQYEFEKEQKKLEYEKKQETARQEAKLKRQRLITYAFIAGFVLLGLLLFVIYKSYRRKTRDNIKLEQKNEEIQTQRDEIEAQRDMATQQRDQIAKQNQIITESIEYARRIQSAVLPQEQTIQKFFPDYFIYFKPKNIVSGDFYWISKIDNKIIIAAADCTGHGVPGAFMSMLGVAFLNEIVNQSKIVRPDEILNQLRSKVIDALHQSAKKRGSRDGMDVSLSVIDTEQNKMYFAGAYNSIYIIRNQSLQEIKADRMPIGVHAVYQDTPFSAQTIGLEQGDRLYFFSDGYFDQFGGEQGNKFGKKSFKELLLQIHSNDMKSQQETIHRTLEDWKGSRIQIDDIMVLGFYYDESKPS
ncbi:MAG: PP2C family protein-serine/threonine phosphatase, partial [Bacteroidota bacterium]